MFSSIFPKVRQDNLILLVLFQVQTIKVDRVIHVVVQINVMIIEMRIYTPAAVAALVVMMRYVCAIPTKVSENDKTNTPNSKFDFIKKKKRRKN